MQCRTQRSVKLGCSSEYTTSENLENSGGSTQFFYSRRPRYQLSTEAALAVLDYGGLRKERSRGNCYGHVASTSRIQKLENRFKSAVSHSPKYPRAAMQWIGEVEYAESIDELVTSASITGDPILDFENLDFKIASGLRKSLTGNVKKQVTTAEGKAQSEKGSLTGTQIVVDDIRVLQNLWRQWCHLGH